ncbi:MAG: T9SS type A sorting domain-containing protein [Bacteroidetes bacterium]|nr:T9SS type A sorting domain-containing protein [Bacteroidota bacterium]
MKSIDNGVTWTVFSTYDFGTPAQQTSVDIVAAGTTAADFKIFISGVRHNIGVNYVAWVDRLDPNTGMYEDEILSESWTGQIMDIKIASDYLYPAQGASPYSLGVLFSKRSTYDSIIFYSSGDGGMSVGNRYALTATGLYCNKVALSFGTCSNWFNGRYFAAWEEFENSVTKYGHIYTSHSNPSFNSHFTNKLSLDSVSGDINVINYCRTPSIATMFNNALDNANTDLTEIVLFDRQYTSYDLDVLGYYNEFVPSSTENNNWLPLLIENTSDYSIEGEINFDPAYNNFLVTYFDSTLMNLPYIVHHLDMTLPNDWITINPGYNDNSNLVNPFPKVEINPVYNQAANVWAGERPGLIGEATYDAEYLPTGIGEVHQLGLSNLEGAFPNPCNIFTKIRFNLNRTETVNVKVFNVFGQNVAEENQTCGSGKTDMTLDVSSLPCGNYIYRFTAGDFISSGSIAVMR